MCQLKQRHRRSQQVPYVRTVEARVYHGKNPCGLEERDDQQQETPATR